MTVSESDADVLPAKLPAVIVYVAAEVIAVGVPEMTPVVPLSCKPDGSIASISPTTARRYRQ